MFVRIKKIQNKKYAYLVENEWTTSGSRQRVKAYLGKVHTPEKKQTRTLALDSMKEFNHLILDAIKWELENHGFTHSNAIMSKEGIFVHLNDAKVVHKNKNGVVFMNEGFLCEHTLKELINFKPSTNQEETSKKLATLAVEAGLNLPTDAFVQLFEKIFKTE